MKLIRNRQILLEDVELATKFFRKAKGLMFRKRLPEKSGMLFVFKEEGQPGFWMLGMRFPIDMIYLSSQMEVIEIKHNVKPWKANPKEWKVYFPSEACKYVLEVNAGFCKKHGIKKWDLVELVK
jgi:uncharacterized membrane protein (UPF0127 family)